MEEQVDSFDRVRDAFVLSIRLKHPMYNCLYLAAAERHDALMVTTDAKFVASAEIAGSGHRMELLA